MILLPYTIRFSFFLELEFWSQKVDLTSFKWIKFSFDFRFAWNCYMQQFYLIFNSKAKWIVICRACCVTKWLNRLIFKMSFVLNLFCKQFNYKILSKYLSANSDGVQDVKDIELKHDTFKDSVAYKHFNFETIDSDKNSFNTSTSLLVQRRIEDSRIWFSSNRKRNSTTNLLIKKKSFLKRFSL